MCPLFPVSCWETRRRSHCFSPHIVTALPEKETRARSPVTAMMYGSSAVALESHASKYNAFTYLWTPSCRVFPSSSPQHQVLVSGMHEKPLRAAFLLRSIKQLLNVVALGNSPCWFFARPVSACAMLPMASELNLLSKSESLANSNTFHRFFLITSFSNSASSSPSNPCLNMAFNIVFRISLDVLLPLPLLSLSTVAPQNATAPLSTTGSTSFSFHRKDRSRLCFAFFSFCKRVSFSSSSK